MIKKHKLQNGLTIITEKISYVKSVTVGLWVGAGSGNEIPENNGISHYIEHMLFKGTKKRTAREIAQAVDNIGGQINAFTGKQYTCYYTRVLSSHIDISFDLLSDMVFNSLFNKNDLTNERNVILEEIKMYEDSPEELSHEILSEAIWSKSSIGYPIIGTNDSLMGLKRKDILKYIEDNYHPENTVIAVAGNFDDEKLLELSNSYFGKWKKKSKIEKPVYKDSYTKGTAFRKKDIEQVHLCMGFEGINLGNDELYALMAMNNVFGSGMSCRLFQKIREEMGLVYSIYGYPLSYTRAGAYTIYAGMNPGNLEKVIELSIQEIKKLKKDLISEDELAKSKEQLKGSYILGLESTSGRMNSIGKSQLLLNRTHSQEEVLEKIEAVTLERVRNVVDSIFILENISTSLVGNLEKNIEINKFL
jgi:predicted Zn-dependent peptidase